MKKLIAALAAVAVGAGVLISPVSAADADPADNEAEVVSSADDSGNCGRQGDNITWSYETATGTLTLTGEGLMATYSQGTAPWFKYAGNIKTLNIGEGILTLGSNSFYYLDNLKSVSLPDSLKTIGISAFEDCTSLKEIDIPENVATIDDCAFWYCKELVNVTVPASVGYIGWAAFAYCNALESITILNPECRIDPTRYTISNDATNHDSYDVQPEEFFYNGVICGYEGSTAQTFATNSGYNFISLGAAPSGSGGSTNAIPGGSGSGDVDGSGSADSTDASLVLKEYACISTGQESSFSKEQNSAADVNTDNVIDSSDASVILRYYAYIATGGTGSLPEYISQ